METLPLEVLFRIWAHELFDYLKIFLSLRKLKKRRTDDKIDAISMKHFLSLTSKRPWHVQFYFSNWLYWLSKYYIPAEHKDLCNYVKAYLEVLCEEELNVSLVLFNSDVVKSNYFNKDRRDLLFIINANIIKEESYPT